MTDRIVVVFGGTGFLGRRIVQHLLDHGLAVRVAARHVPEHAPRLHFVRADIHDRHAIETAIADAYAVVNAVSLYVERGSQTFHSVHVEAAARLASCARQAGIARLVHLSGIGADPGSRSSYIRSRGQGEAAVRAEFATAAIVRPAVMFGPSDKFLTGLAGLLRRLPVYPMFGDGSTKLQPAHVEDVAEAIARILDPSRDSQSLYEFGGPQVLTYRALLQRIAERNRWRRIFLPLPFPVWHMLASLAELLPNPPITGNQVELMQCDTVASTALPGFATLGISPQPVEAVL
jgi:uncharacterized protein YbjT (DUF2867 family)